MQRDIDLSTRCSIGPVEVELLEVHARTGSMRQAALQRGMGYRTAWLLVGSRRSDPIALRTQSLVRFVATGLPRSD